MADTQSGQPATRLIEGFPQVISYDLFLDIAQNPSPPLLTLLKSTQARSCPLGAEMAWFWAVARLASSTGRTTAPLPGRPRYVKGRGEILPES